MKFFDYVVFFLLMGLLVAITSCTKDEIIDDIPIGPEPFESLSEKYSEINSSTSFYQSQTHFDSYLHADYLKQMRYQDQSAHVKLYWPGLGSYIVGDVDGDGKADAIASGLSMCDDHVFSYHPGKLIVVFDYKNSNSKIFVDTSLHASSILLSDFDNDGIADVYLYSHSMKMNMYNNAENIGGGTNISPKQSEIFTFKNRIAQKYEVGYFGDSASAAAGDVDNDGDIDIVQWPTPTVYNNQAYDYEPKILLNQGGFNFTVENILTDYSHLGSSPPPNDNSFYATAIGVFDVNEDGYLDVLVGRNIGPTKEYELYPRFGTSLTAPMVFWGNGTGRYSMGSSLKLSESFHMSRDWQSSVLGFGFTDFDNDGDVDILATTTRAEPNGTHFNGLYYDQYALILWENSNGTYNEVSEMVIENNYNPFREFPNFYSIRMIDIDKDGDYDIVPDHMANFGDYPYTKTRHWKNNNKKFIFNN